MKTRLRNTTARLTAGEICRLENRRARTRGVIDGALILLALAASLLALVACLSLAA